MAVAWAAVAWAAAEVAVVVAVVAAECNRRTGSQRGARD
jgi:hypothetical protein